MVPSSLCPLITEVPSSYHLWSPECLPSTLCIPQSDQVILPFPPKTSLHYNLSVTFSSLCSGIWWLSKDTLPLAIQAPCSQGLRRKGRYLCFLLSPLNHLFLFPCKNFECMWLGCIVSVFFCPKFSHHSVTSTFPGKPMSIPCHLRCFTYLSHKVFSFPLLQSPTPIIASQRIALPLNSWRPTPRVWTIPSLPSCLVLQSPPDL
jgi:hypothetical protein